MRFFTASATSGARADPDAAAGQARANIRRDAPSGPSTKRIIPSGGSRRRVTMQVRSGRALMANAVTVLFALRLATASLGLGRRAPRSSRRARGRS